MVRLSGKIDRVAAEPETALVSAGRTGAFLKKPKGRGQRLAYGIFGFAVTVAFTFLGLLAITFFIGRVVPIDPVLAVVGDRAPQAVYEHVRTEMGLDQPLPIQFVRYVGDVVQGKFGTSVSTGKPVIEDLARVFPATLEMATLGIIIGVLLGVPMGVIAASRQGSWIDQVIRVVGLLGYSVPAFWLGLVGLAVFYARLKWVGGPGRIDIFYDGLIQPVTGLLLVDSLIAGDLQVFWNAVNHLVLPASVLGFFSLAYIARMTRSFMLDQLSQEYVTTARVKGVSERLVIWRHAFNPIRVPLITVIGLSYAGLLEGSVMIETIFSWPGIGNYLTTALLNADMNAVLGATLVIGAVFIGINKGSDVLYRILDPRAR
jgi:peptide/nickel transport system permease protein